MNPTDAMDITFREGTLDDLDRVTAKVHEFAPRMLRGIGASEEQIDEWLLFNASRNRWRKRLGSENSTVFIAERDEVVMGIGYVQLENDLDGAVRAHLGGLYIRKPKRGIGTAIMIERLRMARRLGADYVQLETAEDNKVMRQLAERYKFTEHERYEHPLIGLPFIKYRRALTDFGEDYLLDIGDGDEPKADG